MHSAGGFCILPAPNRGSPHAYHTKPTMEKGDGYEKRSCSESVLQNSLPYVLSWLLCPGEREARDFTCQYAVQVGSFLSGDRKRFHPLQQGFKAPRLVALTDVVRLIGALSVHIYNLLYICMRPTVWCLRKRSFYISAPKLWDIESPFSN